MNLDGFLPTGVDPLYVAVAAVGIFLAFRLGYIKLPKRTPPGPALKPATDLSSTVLALLADDERRADEDAARALLTTRRRSRETEALTRALQRRSEPAKA